MQSSDNSERTGTEVERVDVSRILQYVSPRELERFENTQFKIEAEAQAVADKLEEDEEVRRRMQKNARMAVSIRGRGDRILERLGIDPELQSSGMSRGRPRGRGRGRGRARAPAGASWRGRGASYLAASHRELSQDEIVDSQPDQALDTSPRRLPLESTGTDVESEELDTEDGLPESTSPGLMRSAFVANSALPLSPVWPNRPLPSAAPRQSHHEMPDTGNPDITSDDGQDGSVSSTALQLHFEDDVAIAESESATFASDDGHRNKRRKTESTEPHQELLFPPSSQIAYSESADDSIPADPPSTIKAHRNSHVHGFYVPPKAVVSPSQREEIDNTPSSDEDDVVEEYVVETILEHYYDDQGRKHYLVKWEGYEDSHDWLTGEDLEGAAEVVAEYNEWIRKQKGKERAWKGHSDE